MARKAKKNFYGVRVGRDGPKTYPDWTTCQAAVTGFSGSRYMGFMTLQEAEDWVNEGVASEPQGWFLDPTPDYGCPPKQPRPCVRYFSDLGEARDESRLQEGEMQVVEDSIVDSELTDITGGLPERPKLSEEQARVLDRVMRGENIFFTGSAGTGKSILLRAIIDALGGPSNPSVAVTASTGIAAVNIGGATLHSFAGIGLGKGPADKLVGKVQGSNIASRRWRNTKTLIIDEVSMIDGTFFDTLETIARVVREKTTPFGGIQLVLSGDFCQLPPVPDHLDGVSLPIKFAFEAGSWKECIGAPVVLQKVFRQKDKEFVRMLNSMRFGRIETDDAKLFAALSRPLVYDDGIEPTELFPLRQEVERANAMRLAGLPGPPNTYMALDVPGVDIHGNPITQKYAEKLLERLVALKEVTLKVGAQVMLIKNLIQGHLVNGSQGTVIAFKTVSQALQEHVEIGTVDSSQDRSGTPSEKELRNALKKSDWNRVWPFVRFTNKAEILCIPATFDVVNARGSPEANRDQIPLILAWAMSVHKSQGQTLERVKVNLSRTFEKGQAYVALSRAKQMETLQVLHFDKSRVMAHPRVLKWHADVMRQIQREEEDAIMQEFNSEDALKVFFDDDDDDNSI